MNGRALQAHRTKWAVVIYRGPDKGRTLYDTKEEAEKAAAEIGPQAFVLPPAKAWAGKGE